MGNALRHSAPLCVRRLLMVSPGSKSSLFCIACSFLLLLRCLELEPAIHSVRQKEDHLMCVWLCLIKLTGGELSGEGQTPERLNSKKNENTAVTFTKQVCYVQSDRFDRGADWRVAANARGTYAAVCSLDQMDY